MVVALLLLGVPDDYAVLFLQGGGRLQFWMTAANLIGELGTFKGKSADYLRRTGNGREREMVRCDRSRRRRT